MNFDLNQFENIVSQSDKLSTYRDHLRISVDQDSKRLEILKQDCEDSLKARAFIQEISQLIQNQIEHKVSGLVTMAFEAIFEDPYKAILEFKQQRNKTECEIWLSKEGEKIKPIDSVGGGILDIMSFSYRIAFWSLNPSNPIFIFDEPSRNVSENYRPMVADLISMLARDLGIQIIMTSHIKEFIDVADNVVELR